MANTAPQRHTKSVSEVRNVSIDMRGVLDVGELLTGTPTIVEVTTPDLTLASKAVNSTTLTINGVECVAGQAVTFTVSGGVAGSTYEIRVTVSSNASVPQTFVVAVRLSVIAD